MVIEDLVLDTSVWQTDELRHHKPTPGDEARAGLNIVEQSLWKAVPHYLHHVSDALKKHTGKPLPLKCTPIRYGSSEERVWFDQDGNSNVTAKIAVIFSGHYYWLLVIMWRLPKHSFHCFSLPISLTESAYEDHQSWDHQCYNRNLVKQQAAALPTQLPARADQPSCTECNVGHSHYIRIEMLVILTEDCIGAGIW
ncbi:putative phosphoenolpyruvate carboxylase [Rosa chinensis]|uniref:Putative phosphoenolpyruvate carboxylase n=1 Tax=Rosa chinensis TaxID=74649 RepID=A0A2P6QB85_ROSCH|nr:putative phosphoenolpyruvate carboxylase [Rosa chinensis]